MMAGMLKAEIDCRRLAPVVLAQVLDPRAEAGHYCSGVVLGTVVDNDQLVGRLELTEDASMDSPI